MKQRLIRFTVVLGIVAAVCVGAVFLLSGDLDRVEGENRLKANSAVSEKPAPSLDEETQQYIWDTEHFTFELEWRLFPQIITALRESDVSQLREFLTDEFSGTILTQTSQLVEHNQIQRESRRVTEHPGTKVNAASFAEHLSGRLEEFGPVQKMRFRVLNISAEDRDPATGRWRLRVLLTATGISKDGSYFSFEQTSSMECPFKSDEEIIAGRIVSSWRVLSEDLTTSPALMTEVTKHAGLDRILLHDNWDPRFKQVRQYTAQMACGDWTLDGRPDIAIATLTGRAILLASSDDGRFVDVTSQFGVSGSLPIDERQFLSTLFDFDNDGDPDLLLGSRLYRNIEGRRFDVVENTELRLKFDPQGCVVADYDCDGLLDLFVYYQRSRERSVTKKVGWVGDDNSGAQNQLWRNLGGGRFQEVSLKAGVVGETRHSFAATWFHANDDQYPDLYVANDFAQNSFFLNRGDGTFENISSSSGTADFATSMGVAAADIDGDGKTEIYVANMYSKMGRRIIAQVSESDYPPGVFDQLKGSCAGNRLYQLTGDGRSYKEISSELGINEVGWAYAPAFADFDLDGFLDIYATTGFLSFSRAKPDG